jgi:hypothetical protein
MSMTSQQLRFKFIQHAKSAFISFESCRIKIMLAVLSLLLCLGDTYSGSSVPCGNCTDLDSAALLQSHRAALRKENALLQTDGQEIHEDITNVAPHNLGRYDYFEACSKSTPLSTLEHNFSIKVKMPHVCPDGTRLQKETAAGIVVTGCCSIALHGVEAVRSKMAPRKAASPVRVDMFWKVVIASGTAKDSC